MPNRRRDPRELIIVAGLMLGSCMENPERVPANQLATEANRNALRALRQGEALEARLQRVERALNKGTTNSPDNAS